MGLLIPMPVSTPIRQPNTYCDDTPAILSPDALTRLAQMYCGPGTDPRCIGKLEDLCGGTDLSSCPETAILPTQLTLLRQGACPPGTRCSSEAVNTGHPLFFRQILDHYATRLLASSGGQAGSLNLLTSLNLTAPLNAQIPSFKGELSTDYFTVVRMEWKPHRDGDLVLQGYLDITIKAEDNKVRVHSEHLDITLGQVEGFDIRIRLQPYFAVSPPPQNLNKCDKCGRRLPDETIRWRVVSAGLYNEGTDDPVDVDISAGCDCHERVETCVVGWSICDLPGIDDLPQYLVDEVPKVNATITHQLRVALEGPMSDLSYYITSDPLFGGLLMGRKEAVEDLLDWPECRAGSPPTVGPAGYNPNCDAPTSWSAFEPKMRTDTIEALRVTRVGSQPGAQVLARENP